MLVSAGDSYYVSDVAHHVLARRHDVQVLNVEGLVIGLVWVIFGAGYLDRDLDSMRCLIYRIESIGSDEPTWMERGPGQPGLLNQTEP